MTKLKKICTQTNIPQVDNELPACEDGYINSDCVIFTDVISYLGLPEDSDLTTVINTLILSLQDARNRIISLEGCECTQSPLCNPPTADAGTDFVTIMNTQNSGMTSTKTIDGSGSSHNASSITNATWEVVGTPNGLNNGAGIYIDIDTPNEITTTIDITNDPIAAGVWTLRLTVTNDCGKTDTDEVQITLIDPTTIA